MENKILGIHHITAIAGDAKRNFDFYTKTLGLRFIKRTVNFDDPGTYHFYFGDEKGNAGTILTFFPWGNIPKGRNGAGMATEIGYAVPKGSFDFWMKRFDDNQVSYEQPAERFGEKYLSFTDPDGLKLEFFEAREKDIRTPYVTDDVTAEVATLGFDNITLTLNTITATAKILTDIFDYKLIGQEGNRYRYMTDAVDNANIIDLVEIPSAQRGNNSGGTIHHIAFRVKDDETQMAFRAKIAKAGLNITEQIDRNYFHSLYFREPGGVLFEIATDNPGFTVDEPLEELGTSLKLPAQYESSRKEIESILVKLD